MPFQFGEGASLGVFGGKSIMAEGKKEDFSKT